MTKIKDIKNKIKIGNLELNSAVMLAPMAGITDTVLRSIIREYSKDALLTTEMLSSEALIHKPFSIISTFEEEQRPISFQLVGHKPDIMLKAAKLIEDRADIIDINMGCPVNKIVKGSDGCALMKNPELASDIVKTLKDNINKPITVKIRLGLTQDTMNYVEYGIKMQEAGADAITIHARTRSQMYSGVADWKKIKELKQNLDIPVFANGDIFNLDAAIKCLKLSCADGVAIARGILGNPFLIKQIDYYLKTGEKLPDLSFIQNIEILKKHLDREIALRGELTGIKFMRKFYSYYIRGIKHAAGFRNKLVLEENYDNIIKLLNDSLHCEFT